MWCKSDGLILVELFIVLTILILPVHSQNDLEIDVEIGNQGTVVQGSASYVSVKVKNIQENAVTLRFVGIRFNWLGEDVYLYGDESENDRLLESGASTSYVIYFDVPETISPGYHAMFLLVRYSIQDGDQLTEFHKIMQIEPGLHVMAVATLTETEVVVVTVSANTPLPSNNNVPIVLSAAFGLIAVSVIILVAIRKRQRKGELV